MAERPRAVATNLAVLVKSRRKPEAGDVFVMRPPDGRFLFGRVIRTDADPLGVGGANLVYVYRVRSDDRTPVPPLSRDALLLPPMMTNQKPWTLGYFEHVESRPLAPGDVLPQHCFKDTGGRYFDELGRRLPGPVEPVGPFTLESFRTLDDHVSRALAIPLASD